MPESDRWESCLARPISSFHQHCIKRGDTHSGVKFTYNKPSGNSHAVKTFLYKPAKAPLRESPSMAEDGSECRDWAEMTSDSLASVFAKLDVSDLLAGAGLVCRPWRQVAATDRTLWRRVDMSIERCAFGEWKRDEADAMARAAVDRAAGTMEAFSADFFVNDALLIYVSLRASSLKSLHLSLSYNVTNKGMAEAVKGLGFPQLEELTINFCPNLHGHVCQLIGQACPHLKCFRLNRSYENVSDDDTEALSIANSMPELREIQLIGNRLTNVGLISILVHCPHLQSVDIRRCFNILMDDALKSKCVRIGSLKHRPNDSISDFKYSSHYGFELDDDFAYLDVDQEDDYDFPSYR
ncbi:hypothetical protein GUJ93_ZPchr0002g23375 [Zizania palustris]|uniref:F-box domain-containing protein n=1 Tax=Zizania palustris TaxID=103762 RepID=A0A8J5S2A5_ZIZPA|nr:hypothetical protein GUJ93_ZPchr0002g23375 [Zizania palustris]